MLISSKLVYLFQTNSLFILHFSPSLHTTLLFEQKLPHYISSFCKYLFLSLCTSAGKKTRKMVLLLIELLLVGFFSTFNSVHGYYGGWINAHATFYGGGDASGTMGTLPFYLYLL